MQCVATAGVPALNYEQVAVVAYNFQRKSGAVFPSQLPRHLWRGSE